MLDRQGVDLDAAFRSVRSTSHEAATTARIKACSLVLDYQMQGMSGLEATIALRERHPRLRVIIVTIHDSPELRLASIAGGAHGFVTKKKLYQDLRAEIVRVFELVA